MKIRLKKIVTYFVLLMIGVTQFINIGIAAYQNVDNKDRDDVIIIYKPTANKNAEIDTLKLEYKGEIKKDLKIINGVSARLPTQRIKEIENRPDVISVERDLPVRKLSYVADAHISATEVWNLGFTGSGIRIAILDTGVVTSHPEFQGRIAACHTEVEGTTNCEDDEGHGTAVAGLAMAPGIDYNAIGSAPDAMLLVDKVLNNTGSGTTSQVIAGIEWAVANNANVISMSLGTDEAYPNNNCDDAHPAFKAAIDSAEASGISVVAAAGNGGLDGRNGLDAPACISNVIAVGAIDFDNNIWYGSSTGKAMKDHGVVSGGVDLYSTSIISDGYDFFFTGTSFSAPVVSGAVALMFSKNPDIYPGEIRRLLFSTADCISGSCPDNTVGYGRVNALSAVNNIDMIAPSIIAKTPTGPNNVPVDTKITVTFNELMKNSSAETAFSTLPETHGSFSWAGNTMTYTPNSNLSQGTNYIVTVGTGARDSAGNYMTAPYSWEFKTELKTADISPPIITANSPTGNNVPVNTQINVTFNESMNTSSSQSAFSILPPTNGIFSWAGNTMTYSPNTNLNQGTTFNITVRTDAKDIAGNNMLSSYSWEFTTESSTGPNVPDVSNPSANQTIPDDTDYTPLWGETAQLNVTVTDGNGIESVKVDLSEIGGSAAKPMMNIGGNIWSATTNASAGTINNTYSLPVNATNTLGKSNNSVLIQLKVMKNGDTTGNGKVNIGDALLCANNVSSQGNPAYILSSIYVADVNGNGVINIGDCLRLANNVSRPGDPNYILK